MSYYKITYESNTIEGLKAIQGSLLGHEVSATDSNTFETRVPPPPPPRVADSALMDIGLKGEIPLPPPRVADSAIMDIGLEGEIPPPPKDELQDQEGNEAKPDEGFAPPQQSASKSPKAAKKSSNKKSSK